MPRQRSCRCLTGHVCTHKTQRSNSKLTSAPNGPRNQIPCKALGIESWPGLPAGGPGSFPLLLSPLCTHHGNIGPCLPKHIWAILAMSHEKDCMVPRAHLCWLLPAPRDKSPVPTAWANSLYMGRVQFGPLEEAMLRQACSKVDWHRVLQLARVSSGFARNGKACMESLPWASPNFLVRLGLLVWHGRNNRKAPRFEIFWLCVWLKHVCEIRKS